MLAFTLPQSNSRVSFSFEGNVKMREKIYIYVYTEWKKNSVTRQIRTKDQCNEQVEKKQNQIQRKELKQETKRTCNTHRCECLLCAQKKNWMSSGFYVYFKSEQIEQNKKTQDDSEYKLVLLNRLAATKLKTSTRNFEVDTLFSFDFLIFGPFCRCGIPFQNLTIRIEYDRDYCKFQKYRNDELL